MGENSHIEWTAWLQENCAGESGGSVCLMLAN